jgi:hypothetical protein
MKKLLSILLILSLLLMVGCDNTGPREPKTDDRGYLTYVEGRPEASFKYLSKTDYIGVVYNLETKVMYSISRGMYNNGNLYPLYNPDGSLMIYRGE